MEDCIFCKIISGEIPATKVYEDNDVFAFLDIQPINFGHVLVIPKEHYKDLSVTPKELVCKSMEVVHKLIPVIKKATGADAVNIGINIGENAGQEVFHTHIHIMPRFSDDGYEVWHSKKTYAEGEMDKMSALISEQI